MYFSSYFPTSYDSKVLTDTITAEQKVFILKYSLAITNKSFSKVFICSTSDLISGTNALLDYADD